MHAWLHFALFLQIPGKLKEMIFIDITYEMTTNTLASNAEIPCQVSLQHDIDYAHVRIKNISGRNVPQA